MSVLKSWLGEKLTALNMGLRLNKNTYRRFHNVSISEGDGVGHIEELFVSKYGIFIVETQHRPGEIAGEDRRSQWLQILDGERFVFANPLRKVLKQKKALARFLDIDEAVINGIVYFAGDNQFKLRMSHNVINHSLCGYIRRFDETLFSEAEKRLLCTRLEHSVSQLTRNTKDSDVSIPQAITSSCLPRNPSNADVIGLSEGCQSAADTCPDCGESLVQHRAYSQANTGAELLACSGFPQCRFVRGGSF